MPGPPRLGEERVVLHVPRTDLDDVRDFCDVLSVPYVEELGDDREAGFLLGLLKEAKALHSEALEGVRRRAGLVRPSAEHRRASARDPASRLEDHVAALHGAGAGDDAEVSPSESVVQNGCHLFGCLSSLANSRVRG